MNNTFKKLSILCSLTIIFSCTLLAQDGTRSIKRADSVNLVLKRFGLEMFAYPDGFDRSACPPLGPPKYAIPKPEWPILEDPEPVVVIGDTANVLLKTDKLRNVFWIHGLNGTTGSWAIAAKASQFGVPNDPDFPARKLRSYTGTPSSSSNPVQLYSEDLGIAATSGDLENYAHSNVPNADRTIDDFIIAHSQGGIVGRQWLRNMDKYPALYSKYAYGLVTFGTPHSGAEVLNNCRPNLGRNRVPAFMQEACQSLGGAIIVPKINSNFITSLVPSNVMKGIISSGCNVLSGSIIPIAMDNYYKPTTKDFYVGAPFLEGETVNGVYVQGLNQYTSQVPVVQFYGAEEQPILWRFMSSTMDIGEVQKNSPNAEQYFGYSNDDHLPAKVNSLINDFTAGYNYEKHQEKKNKDKLRIALFSLPYTGNIGMIVAAGYLKNMLDAQKNKEAYDKGNIWLTNANDYYLTDLIGARESSTRFRCEVTGVVYCRSALYNPVGSGVPATELAINLTQYPTNNACTYYSGQALTWTNYHYSSPWNTNTAGNCTGTINQVVSGWVTTYGYKENDGVVLAESAKFPISVAGGRTKSYVKMIDTNHDQMKNCEETKRGLKKLYDGKLGPFFQTDKQ